MTRTDKATERVGAMMSALREVTAECRAVEGLITGQEATADPTVAIAERMVGVAFSLNTLVTRAIDLQQSVAEEGIRGDPRPMYTGRRLG